MDAALDLPSPYAGEVVLEKDLQFAVQQAVRHGLSIQQLRNEALVAFRTLARASGPTDNGMCTMFLVFDPPLLQRVLAFLIGLIVLYPRACVWDLL